jgi:hypothetical protein
MRSPPPLGEGDREAVEGAAAARVSHASPGQAPIPAPACAGAVLPPMGGREAQHKALE